MTVYRGCVDSARFGKSWTTDVDLARRFASGEMTSYRVPGTVYVFAAPPMSLLAFIHESERAESEYVIHPRWLSDEVITVLSDYKLRANQRSYLSRRDRARRAVLVSARMPWRVSLPSDAEKVALWATEATGIAITVQTVSTADHESRSSSLELVPDQTKALTHHSTLKRTPTPVRMKSAGHHGPFRAGGSSRHIRQADEAVGQAHHPLVSAALAQRRTGRELVVSPRSDLG